MDEAYAYAQLQIGISLCSSNSFCEVLIRKTILSKYVVLLSVRVQFTLQQIRDKSSKNLSNNCKKLQDSFNYSHFFPKFRAKYHLTAQKNINYACNNILIMAFVTFISTVGVGVLTKLLLHPLNSTDALACQLCHVANGIPLLQ